MEAYVTGEHHPSACSRFAILQHYIPVHLFHLQYNITY